jgi:hypothetical protein
MVETGCTGIREEIRLKLEHALRTRAERVGAHQAREMVKRTAESSFLRAAHQQIKSVVEPSIREFEAFLGARGISLDMKTMDVGGRLICEINVVGDESWSVDAVFARPHLRLEFCSQKRRVLVGRMESRVGGPDGGPTETHLYKVDPHFMENEIADAVAGLIAR